MIKPKIKLKSCLLVLIFISICFCLAGCSQVSFTTSINDNGTVDECLTITLDEHLLRDNNFNVEVEKLNIKIFAKTTANNLITEYKQKLRQDLDKENITLEEYNNFSKSISCVEHDWQNNVYIIGLQFANSQSYTKYYQLLNTTNTKYSSEKTIEKALYTKTYYYQVSHYARYGLFGQIHQYYSNRYGNISQNSTLQYNYIVSSKRFHSNADVVTADNNGNYIHTWNIPSDNLDRQLYFYTKKANAGMWVTISITISLAITTILCIIAIWKSPSNNNSINPPTDINID